MKKNKIKPTTEQLEKELNREKYKKRYFSVLKNTIYTLITVSACAVLVATLWIPVLQIHGSSMSPTLNEGQIVVSFTGSTFEREDLVAFYLGNKLLVKRIIGCPGDIINIKDDGTVYVNGKELDEPYISEKSLGECDLKFPYQVPESRYFLMGDHRKTSIDSRSTIIGCVSTEQIVGEIVYSIWPISQFGKIK